MYCCKNILFTIVIINKMYAAHDNFHSLNKAVFLKGWTPLYLTIIITSQC